MDNSLTLKATISRTAPLRYTPAGLPVLELSLEHHSEQCEAGQMRQVHCELAAKIIGKTALDWQQQTGAQVTVQGFLARRGLRHPGLVLHIQTIDIDKG